MSMVSIGTIGKMAVGGALVGIGFQSAYSGLQKLNTNNDSVPRQVLLTAAGAGALALGGGIGFKIMMSAGPHASSTPVKLAGLAASVGAMALMASPVFMSND